jgi:hypothetical protein
MYFAANPFMEHTQYTGGKIDEEMLYTLLQYWKVYFKHR